MRNRIAQQALRDAFEAAEARSAGRYLSILSFSSEMEIMQRISDISKLPSATNNIELQDEDGNFYAMFNYSAWDGPDIFAP